MRPSPNSDPKIDNGTGFRRIINAGRVSFAGFKVAFTTQAAFRQELVVLLVFLTPTFFFDLSGVERALLIGSALLVLIVELLNSAIELALDRVSTEFNTLTMNAKDIGSAAVFLALVNFIVIWLCIFVPMFRTG